MTYHNNQTHP